MVKLRQSGYMILIMVGFIILMLISSMLPIPPWLAFALYLLFVFALIMAGTMIPFFIASGKHFLSLTITVTENEKDYAYGMVRGDLRPLPLKKLELEKLTGEEIKGNIYAYYLVLEEVPFMEDTGDYEAILLSREPLKIDELTLVDKLTPDIGVASIQAHYGSIRCVKIGEIVKPVEKKGIKAWFRKVFKRDPIKEHKSIPLLVVYATHKEDKEVLKKIKKSVVDEEIGKELVTVNGRAFYDHARSLVIIDETTEKLLQALTVCRETLVKVLSADIEQYEVKIEQYKFVTPSRLRELLKGKYTWIALGLLAGAFIVLILLKLLGG